MVQQSLPLHDKFAQTARILRLLKTKKTVTNFELNNIAFRYSARIKDLRDEGHRIVSTHITGSQWTFTYLGHEDDDDHEYPDVA